MDDYDFIIIGAGASGINAAHQVQTQFPSARYIVLEARDAIGGTWEFFKYPGLRSDSSLTSFGFRWRPWSEEKVIAEGDKIQKYLEDCAAYAGIDKHIQFKNKVTGAHWSSDENKWTVEVDIDGGQDKRALKGTYVIACSGYYDYEKPLQAEITGITDFGGTVVHPQFWPEDLDYSGKRVVIIGSGATSVTLLPVLAKTAAKVTMLQRSPTYVLPIASAPGHVQTVQRLLPKRVADTINFWQSVIVQTLIRVFCLTFPALARKILISVMAKELEGSGIPVDPHFTPRYNPWDQRLCICPDGDFYKALHGGNCDVVTDHIETVTESGIKTESGRHIDADIIITATGLRVFILGGIDCTVDGQRFKMEERFAWRNCMLEGVPNMALVIGYTRISWTLGSDVCLRLLLRVIHHMKKIGAVAVRPVVQDRRSLKAEPFISMKSTYFLAARDTMPRKSNVEPWDERKGFISENLFVSYGRIGTITKGLEFTMGLGEGQGRQEHGKTNGHAIGHDKAD